MRHDMMNHNNDLFDAMNDWFDLPRKFFDDKEFSHLMQADIHDNNDNYMVTLDLPGIDKKEINLTYNSGVLSVTAVRKNSSDSMDKNNLVLKERSEGRISRSFRLPNVVASEIHAKYDNGVLTITLPKQTSGDGDNSIQID